MTEKSIVSHTKNDLKVYCLCAYRTGDGYKPLIAAKPSIESGKMCFDGLAKLSDGSTQPLHHDRKHYKKNNLNPTGGGGG